MTKFILVATKILHNSGMFKKKKEWECFLQFPLP